MKDFSTSPWAGNSWSMDKWNSKQWGQGGKYALPIPTEEEIAELGTESDEDSETTINDTDPKNDKKYLKYTIDITEAKDVRSISIQEYKENQVMGAYDKIKNVRKRLFELIDNLIDLYGKGEDEEAKTTKQRLEHVKNRWNWLTKLEMNADPTKLESLPVSKDYIIAAIADDKIDYAFFDGGNYGPFRGEMDALHSALEAYLQTFVVLEEEAIEVKRYDKYFNSANTTKIRKAIKSFTLTAADIKALAMQETGDFLSKGDTGIGTKTKGIPLRGAPDDKVYVGIGQIGTAARADGIRWAKKHGVDIPSSPDPRMNPPDAIVLIPAILGDILEKIKPHLPKTRPEPVEFKKIVWGAYNIGPNKMISIITRWKELNKEKDAKLTYAKLAVMSEMTSAKGQGAEYVIGIMRRLTWKD